MRSKNRLVVSFFLILLFLLFLPTGADAQVGYNPEYLGNAAAAPRPGFSPKIFFDYFNQNKLDGNDFEVAFEPQYWIRGFTGEEKKDYIQFLAHIPFGYRSQKNAGGTDLGWGLGSINTNVEHFWKILDGEDSVWWFDNGLSVSYPTATGKENLRIGGNSYTVTWFQENFIKVDRWMFSISPISVTYAFRDHHSHALPGISLNIMNSAYGYQFSDIVAAGVTTALQLGNQFGTDDGFGGKLKKTQRLYVGPAFCFSFKHDISVQVSGMIDAYTKNVYRGQGVAIAFWHMF